MEGRIYFEYRWGLNPVLVYALCHTNPIFDLDYQNKRSKTPNNMSSRKRSNTYWSTNTFASLAPIRIARPICLSRRQQYVLTDQYVIAGEQQYVLVDQYVFAQAQQYVSTKGVFGSVRVFFGNVFVRYQKLPLKFGNVFVLYQK